MVKTVAFYEAARRLVADFRRAKRGNVAITFALALLPLVGATAAAIDYRPRQQCQNCPAGGSGCCGSDSLEGSTGADHRPASGQSGKRGQGKPAQSEHKGLVVTPTFTTIDTGSYKLTVTATGTVDTTVAAIW